MIGPRRPRHPGAAPASRLAIADVDHGAVAMVAIVILKQAIYSFAAATYYRRRAPDLLDIGGTAPI